MSIESGTLIAKRYRVERALGRGGMGEVFSAENIRTGRHVAIKVLRAESKLKASAVERFRREAKAAGAIVSDHVTQVLDVEDDPEHGIVLVFELLQGESLVERLKRTGPLSFAELWPIVEAVWIGLADAHAAGIVHRDLKPSNVFLETRPGSAIKRVKILDFGISKLPKQMSADSLTQVGQSLGTFSFMPPEQIGKAKNVDHRADIYACATLVYQGLSGQLPYTAKNVVTMMELKTRTEPRTLAEAMGAPVDPRLEAFITKGLMRDPDQRFQTALEALEAWRKLRPSGAYSFGDPDSAPPPYSVISGPGASGPSASPPASFMAGPTGVPGPPAGRDGARPSQALPRIEAPTTIAGAGAPPVPSTSSTAPLSVPTRVMRQPQLTPQANAYPPSAARAEPQTAPSAPATSQRNDVASRPVGGPARPPYPSSAPQIFNLPSLVPASESSGGEDGVTIPRMHAGQSFGSGTLAMKPEDALQAGGNAPRVNPHAVSTLRSSGQGVAQTQGPDGGPVSGRARGAAPLAATVPVSAAGVASSHPPVSSGAGIPAAESGPHARYSAAPAAADSGPRSNGVPSRLGIRAEGGADASLVVEVSAPRSRRRLWITFALGAIGLMVVGFVAVALIMRLLGQN